MAFRAVLVCAQAFLIHAAFSQCLGPAGRPGAFGLAGPVLGPGALGPACGAAVASTGGGFPVTSGSPIAPTGVSLVSENAIEGALAVGGNLPLLGSVGLEGAFPTAGAGAVSYGCGDGAVGIVSEGPITTGIVGPGPVGPLGGPGLGYGPGVVNGLDRVGAPCGAIY